MHQDLKLDLKVAKKAKQLPQRHPKVEENAKQFVQRHLKETIFRKQLFPQVQTKVLFLISCYFLAWMGLLMHVSCPKLLGRHARMLLEVSGKERLVGEMEVNGDTLKVL